MKMKAFWTVTTIKHVTNVNHIPKSNKLIQNSFIQRKFKIICKNAIIKDL